MERSIYLEDLVKSWLSRLFLYLHIRLRTANIHDQKVKL